MTKKTHGPLQEDYIRALKAAKRMGAKVVRVEIGNGAIAILLDDAYLEKVGFAPSPAPDLPPGGKPKLGW